MKKAYGVLAVVLAAVALTGCTLFRINPERDGARVVASVGQESITKKEVYDALQIDWDTKVESWEEEDFQAAKEEALADLVMTTILRVKCREMGFYTFDQEDLDAIEAKYDEYVGDVYNQALETQQKLAEEDDSIDPHAEAQKTVETYLAIYGYTMESFREGLEESRAFEKLNEYVNSAVVVSDEEIQTEYDSQVYSQTLNYTTSSAAISAFNQGTPIVVYPAAMHRVRHILIAFDTEDTNELVELRAGEDDEAADAFREEAAKAIEEEALEIYDKLQNGESFEVLQKKHNDDTGASSLPNGYLVSADYDGYVTEFRDGAMALSAVGEYSQPVLSDYGYHIIVLEEIMPAGTMTLDKCRQAIEKLVRTTKEVTLWSEKLVEWNTELGVKTYTKRLQ